MNDIRVHPEYVALRISKENISSLSYFNGGVTPDPDAIGDVFVYPLQAYEAPEIVDVVDFFEDYLISVPEKLNDKFALNCFRHN